MEIYFPMPEGKTSSAKNGGRNRPTIKRNATRPYDLSREFLPRFLPHSRRSGRIFL